MGTLILSREALFNMIREPELATLASLREQVDSMAYSLIQSEGKTGIDFSNTREALSKAELAHMELRDRMDLVMMRFCSAEKDTVEWVRSRNNLSTILYLWDNYTQTGSSFALERLLPDLGTGQGDTLRFSHFLTPTYDACVAVLRKIDDLSVELCSAANNPFEVREALTRRYTIKAAVFMEICSLVHNDNEIMHFCNDFMGKSGVLSAAEMTLGILR